MYFIYFTIYWFGLFGLTSHRHQGRLETLPYLLSLVKDVELGFYTVPTRYRTLGRYVEVHYTTAAPRQLH